MFFNIFKILFRRDKIFKKRNHITLFKRTHHAKFVRVQQVQMTSFLQQLLWRIKKKKRSTLFPIHIETLRSELFTFVFKINDTLMIAFFFLSLLRRNDITRLQIKPKLFRVVLHTICPIKSKAA